MIFEVPGQLRGPETKKAMVAAIRVRKELESQFREMEDPRKLSLVLRVGGSLGTFGEDGIENVEIGDKKLVCDVVISPRNWGRMSDEEAYLLVRSRAVKASSVLLEKAGVGTVPGCIIEFRNAEPADGTSSSA